MQKYRRRAYSSKTRIKTLQSSCEYGFRHVGEHIPVKQGLRPESKMGLNPLH